MRDEANDGIVCAIWAWIKSVKPLPEVDRFVLCTHLATPSVV